jgi:hypothetical protein
MAARLCQAIERLFWGGASSITRKSSLDATIREEDAMNP